jgi:TatD DNase family protein
MEYPTLDAHPHVKPTTASKDLEASGAVLAMSLSLEEAVIGIHRKESRIVWGAGCHPRSLQAQKAFNPEQFTELVENTGIVGEVGLDTGSRVPIELQLTNFRQILETVGNKPRLVSIHSYRATGLVLKELQRKPISTPVLHWWTGSADETSQAVALGCYFSIHSAVARQTKFRTRVPPERILLESDHGYNDPPAAIPCRVEWVEYLVAQQIGLGMKAVRELVWGNLAAIVRKLGIGGLFPNSIMALLSKSLMPANGSGPANL